MRVIRQRAYAQTDSLGRGFCPSLVVVWGYAIVEGIDGSGARRLVVGGGGGGGGGACAG